MNELFGPVNNEDLESNVALLFSKSSGPLDNLKVKAKLRTVLPELSAPEVTEVTEDQIKYPNDENPANDHKPIAKKKNKNKCLIDESDDLECQYYSKLLNNNESPKNVSNIIQTSDAHDIVDETDVKKNINTIKLNLNEDEIEKSERTVFVGNVPCDVITSKKLYKKFKRLLSMNPSDEIIKGNCNLVSESEDKAVEACYPIESIRFRSISFEESLPRKLAFVQQKFHKSRNSLNAYVVYKDKSAVAYVCKRINGYIFEDHHLRVDSVLHPATHDKKRSIFIGNLDFEEVEETLWRHFEPCGTIEYVRIVRDSKTNLGKGFAYIQFKDFQSVNKALLLNDKKINGDIKSRKLRVSRCKNIAKIQTQLHCRSKKLKNLTDDQKTKLGRVKKVLGKADRAKIDTQLTIEGMRVTKEDKMPILNRKKNRSKFGRVTKRSQAFKNSIK